jgi:hypothetical protein
MNAPWPCFICGSHDLDCGHWEKELWHWLREPGAVQRAQASFETQSDKKLQHAA